MGILPGQSPLRAQASAQHLMTRLDWGEPALTILDVRNRNLFNARHILGAISIPRILLIGRALDSLELTRDIYIYGEADEESAEAASGLRQVGFQNVAELKGGLAAWEAVGGPVEGSSTASI